MYSTVYCQQIIYIPFKSMINCNQFGRIGSSYVASQLHMLSIPGSIPPAYTIVGTGGSKEYISLVERTSIPNCLTKSLLTQPNQPALYYTALSATCFSVRKKINWRPQSQLTFPLKNTKELTGNFLSAVSPLVTRGHRSFARQKKGASAGSDPSPCLKVTYLKGQCHEKSCSTGALG